VTTAVATEPLLSASAIADLLGVKTRWVVEKARAGHLPSYRLPDSNRLRFRWSEIEEALTKED
jgi:excisionase family DNA binding protein